MRTSHRFNTPVTFSLFPPSPAPPPPVKSELFSHWMTYFIIIKSLWIKWISSSNWICCLIFERRIAGSVAEPSYLRRFRLRPLKMKRLWFRLNFITTTFCPTQAGCQPVTAWEWKPKDVQLFRIRNTDCRHVPKDADVKIDTNANYNYRHIMEYFF